MLTHERCRECQLGAAAESSKLNELIQRAILVHLTLRNRFANTQTGQTEPSRAGPELTDIASSTLHPVVSIDVSRKVVEDSPFWAVQVKPDAQDVGPV